MQARFMPLPDKDAYIVECIYCGFHIEVPESHFQLYDRVGCMQCNKSFDVSNLVVVNNDAEF